MPGLSETVTMDYGPMTDNQPGRYAGNLTDVMCGGFRNCRQRFYSISKRRCRCGRLFRRINPFGYYNSNFLQDISDETLLKN